MADGTVKQVNPFTGVEVWSVPGRGRKPLGDTAAAAPSPLTVTDPEAHCAFCASRHFETAPEKARVVFQGGAYRTDYRVSPSAYAATTPVFRRVANLFEILSLDYWHRNYNYKLSAQNLRWKDAYLAEEAGLRHVLGVLDWRLRRTGKSDEEIARIPLEEKLRMTDSFFGGTHELIIAARHYRAGARFSDELFSTGDMSGEEHFQYYRFIIDAMRDIVSNNRYTRQLSVFKNWLRPAGATFDHLHTQIVAIDEWGASMERKIKMIIEDKNVYNAFGPNFAGHHNLVFAENETAIAFAGIGHRYPTIEVFSKSPHARPTEHTDDEVHGMSDLVRACHCAIGGDTSINEEWYHTPVDSLFKMPWHVFIRMRITTPAGFEGGTYIYINPLTPTDLRDLLVPRLYELRAAGVIPGDIRIAEECVLVPNPLQYYKNT